jgi:hypothetical protein
MAYVFQKRLRKRGKKANRCVREQNDASSGGVGGSMSGQEFADVRADDGRGNWLDVDTAVTQLRSKYVPIVRGVLPGKKAATFFRLDGRISMMDRSADFLAAALVQSQQ